MLYYFTWALAKATLGVAKGDMVAVSKEDAIHVFRAVSREFGSKRAG